MNYNLAKIIISFLFKYAKVEERNQFAQMRMIQGLYAPFQAQKEREAAAQIGRLPCLRSSNLMMQVLKGTDETLEIHDILNSTFIIYFSFNWIDHLNLRPLF